MEINNKVFIVYGAGTSGISAYKFLESHGARVYLYNDKKINSVQITLGEHDKLAKSRQDVNNLSNNEGLEELSTSNYNILHKFTDIEDLKIDYAVISPGVQILGNKFIKKLKEINVNIISELELGYLFTKGKFIAITGTNGKTTCTYLLNHILSKKYKTFMCGNIGIPITSICDKTNEESVIICEVSSFMLELVSENFFPDISVITNITPDHISRHKTFENYKDTKLKITKFQTDKCSLIVSSSLQVESPAKVYTINGKRKFKSKLIGEFNQENIEFCYMVCKILGMKDKDFKKYLKTFSPVPYRMEVLGKKKGTLYINDSKSTNPDSTVNALKAIKKPVILLLGGSDKGNDFYNIFEQNNIKLAIIYGQTADKLEKDALFSGYMKTCKFLNLKDALYYLKNLTSRGDIVLFSPACASYDEFNNYIERGECFNNFFKELV